MLEAPHNTDARHHSQEEESTQRLDRWGVALSGLCAVHCIAVPIVFAWLPFQHFAQGVHFHWLMAAVLLPLGGFAFWRGFKMHHRKLILGLGSVGFTLLILGLALEPPHGATLQFTTDLILTVSGSFILIFTHWRNMHLYRCHECEAGAKTR